VYGVYAKLLSPEALFFLISKCTSKGLVTGLCPDPLGELTALPKHHSWTKGVGSLGRGGKDGTPRGERKGQSRERERYDSEKKGR